MADEQQKELGDTPIREISDSKAKAEESFLKELDDAEKTPTVPEAPAAKQQAAVPGKSGGDKPKSKFVAAVDAASKPKRKHSMDPILAVSLAILLIASAVVLANSGYSQFIEKGQNTLAAYGDTVEVQYTGSFNAYYDANDHANGAIVFDTNVEDVGKYLDDNADAHSWGYTKKTSYTNLSFTVGGDSVLKKFGSATINHKVGDTIQVHLDIADGYELPSTSKGKLEPVAIGSEIVMTTSDFTSLFGYSAPTAITYMKFSDATKKYCPFGCDYSVCIIDSNVHVVNCFEAGKEYKAFGLDNAVIKVADGKIDYSKVTVAEKGKMTKVPVFHENKWTVGYVYTDGGVKMFKTGETLGSDLYFNIKVEKITKA